MAKNDYLPSNNNHPLQYVVQLNDESTMNRNVFSRYMNTYVQFYKYGIMSFVFIQDRC